MLDFLGGLLGNALNFFGTQQNNKNQMAIAQQQMALQKEFAQNGIQWKVADANAAGVHPLVGLGASTTSYSPVSVGTEAPKFDFSNMGQDLTRAFQAAQSQEERATNDAAQIRKNVIQKGALENDLLRTELVSKQARLNQGGQIGPQMPTGWASLVDGSRSPYRASDIAVDDDPLKAREVGAPQVKSLNIYNPFGKHITWRQDPNLPSGQDMEDQLGENPLTDLLQGWNTLGQAHYGFNFGFPWNPSRGRRTSSGGGMNRPRGMKGSYR